MPHLALGGGSYTIARIHGTRRPLDRPGRCRTERWNPRHGLGPLKRRRSSICRVPPTLSDGTACQPDLRHAGRQILGTHLPARRSTTSRMVIGDGQALAPMIRASVSNETEMPSTATGSPVSAERSAMRGGHHPVQENGDRFQIREGREIQAAARRRLAGSAGDDLPAPCPIVTVAVD